MSRDEIPNFTKLDQIPVNYAQQLETSVLEPTVFNQGTATTDGFCRFTLANKGFLHSHSKIMLALAPSSGGLNYLTPNVGIGQVVKRAVLKIGNKVINEVDTWAGLQSFKSSLIANENNLEREQYTTGRWLSHQYQYNDESRVQADTYGLANGQEYTGDDLDPPSWSLMDSDILAECPSYSIDISDLFGFLKIHQLPLYLITEPVVIELTFYPTVDYRCQLENGGTADQPVDIVRNELVFCADYIYYGTEDEMDIFADQNKGDLSFTFADYRVIEHSTTAAALTSGVIRNIGMANRLVNRVITQLVASGVGEDSILGRWNALGPTSNASGVLTGIKYNIRYNDRFEYSTDITNPSSLLAMTAHSEGVPPFVTRAEWCGEGNETDSGGIGGTLLGSSQTDNLGAHFFNLSTRLTSGRVGSRGLELHISGGFDTNIDLIRCYAEYTRTARLRDGFVEVYND